MQSCRGEPSPENSRPLYNCAQEDFRDCAGPFAVLEIVIMSVLTLAANSVPCGENVSGCSDEVAVEVGKVADRG